MVYLLYGLFFISCLVLVGSVLLQPGKTDAGALFTSNVSSSAFAPRGTATVLVENHDRGRGGVYAVGAADIDAGSDGKRFGPAAIRKRQPKHRPNTRTAANTNANTAPTANAYANAVQTQTS